MSKDIWLVYVDIDINAYCMYRQCRVNASILSHLPQNNFILFFTLHVKTQGFYRHCGHFLATDCNLRNRETERERKRERVRESETLRDKETEKTKDTGTTSSQTIHRLLIWLDSVHNDVKNLLSIQTFIERNVYRMIYGWHLSMQIYMHYACTVHEVSFYCQNCGSFIVLYFLHST